MSRARQCLRPIQRPSSFGSCRENLQSPGIKCKAAATRDQRTGAAAVELAVCLPLLVLIVFGSLECSRMIYLTQALHVASYEGARLASQRDVTNAEVIDRANEVLDLRNVRSASIAFDPPDLSDAVHGQNITVTLSAPSDENCVISNLVFQGMTLLGQTTMVKEQSF